LSIKLSVVLPAYNEAAWIEHNLIETVLTLQQFVRDFEVIVVDDGSADETALMAAATAVRFPEIKVLRYEENRGKGHALMCGSMHASGEFVAFLDADMDLHPRQLKRFLQELQNSDADVVIGSKNHPGSRIESYPLLRKIYSKAYYRLVRALFGLPVRDTQTGIKMFRRHVLSEVVPRLLVKRFAFDMELLAVAHRKGFSIIEAPVSLAFRRAGSRIDLGDAMMTLRDTLALFYRANVIRYYDTPINSIPEFDFFGASLVEPQGHEELRTA
jgi:glycosyltransferase involved in cell wall biosynthesis